MSTSGKSIVGLDDLVTAAHIGRRLGISRERVRQLAQRGDFPKPIGRLGHYLVWRWSDVQPWRDEAGRKPIVEIYSATDPPHLSDRKVWYWAELDGRRFKRSNDYASVAAQAEKLRARYDTVIIDRSDKDSGVLAATLRSAR